MGGLKSFECHKLLILFLNPDFSFMTCHTVYPQQGLSTLLITINDLTHVNQVIVVPQLGFQRNLLIRIRCATATPLTHSVYCHLNSLPICFMEKVTDGTHNIQHNIMVGIS